jgi:predicted ribosome quality control (RQC) complex YloA/Tae2 family protein
LKDLGEVEVVRAIARFLGVGGVYAEEILLRSKVEKTKHCNTVTNLEIDAIFNSLQSLLSTVSSFKMEPRIILAEDDTFIDVVPLKLKRYEAFKSQPYSSFSEALDEFYLRATAAEKVVATSGIDELQREAERLKRIVTEQEQALRDAESKAESDKHIGNVIYAHSSELQVLLDKFSAAKEEGKEWAVIVAEVLTAKPSGRTPEAFVESFDGRNVAVNVCIDNLRFSISLRKSLFENAAEFYERGKKAKQKSAGTLVALEESRGKLAAVEQKIGETEAMERTQPLEVMEELVKRKVQSKEWYEKFRWFISSNGFLVVAGKDAVSNEVLVKKYARVGDAVFHADIMGAPFVVVKAEGKDPSEQALREAGEFAVSFSRAWREGFGSADVYWVKPDQLSKSGPSGESVPHGAFAVIGKRNWMRSVPLRLGIGVVEDDEANFVGGPVEAVKAKTKTYVTIGPGDNLGKDFLKQVLRVLTLKLPKEQREKLGKTSIEQIREFVPYTKGRIVETVS